ncbi:uncharacterized protein LOC144662136 isoform X2 [Oculina patagonica]
MDPKVEKLLEGKSDEEKFQAIAFSFRCLLTRPTLTNSERDTLTKDELRAKEKLNREPKYSFEESSDEEGDDVSDELWAKEKLKREPKYSFEKSRDEKDDDVSDELWAKVKLNREPKYSFEKWSDEEDDDVSAKQGVFQTNSAKEKLGRKVSAPGNVNSRQSSEKVSHSKQF